jgi:hypothetical protein
VVSRSEDVISPKTHADVWMMSLSISVIGWILARLVRFAWAFLIWFVLIYLIHLALFWFILLWFHFVWLTWFGLLWFMRTDWRGRFAESEQLQSRVTDDQFQSRLIKTANIGDEESILWDQNEWHVRIWNFLKNEWMGEMRRFREADNNHQR